jgi:hypothetical protein
MLSALARRLDSIADGTENDGAPVRTQEIYAMGRIAAVMTEIRRRQVESRRVAK